MAKKWVGHRIEERIPLRQISRRNLVPLQTRCKQTCPVIPHVADVQQIIGSKRVLGSRHPLLHVRSLPVVVNYGGSKADILQSSRAIAGGQPFRGKCRAARRKNTRGGFTASIWISAQGRGGVRPVL